MMLPGKGWLQNEPGNVAERLIHDVDGVHASLRRVAGHESVDVSCQRLTRSGCGEICLHHPIRVVLPPRQIMQPKSGSRCRDSSLNSVAVVEREDTGLWLGGRPLALVFGGCGVELRRVDSRVDGFT